MTAPVSAAVRHTTVAAVLLVAGVAAVVSYAHMQTVAARAGESWRSLLLPLSVDGLIVAASMVLLTRRRAGLGGGALAWCALLGGVAASLAANVAAAEPTVTARLVAAWPAVAFAVAFELLLEQRRPAASTAADEAADSSIPGPPTSEPAQAKAPPAAAAHPAPAPAREPAPVAAPPAVATPAAAAAAAARPAATRGDRGGRAAEGLGSLAERARQLAAANGGRAPGRRVLARELQVTEHKARMVLDAIAATAGTETASANGHGAAAPGGGERGE